MIRNFLFDIGNVLLKFDFVPMVRKLNHRAELAFDDVMAMVLRHRDLAESGRITSSQFLDQLCADLGFPGEPEAAAAIYADIFTENPPMFELARDMRGRGMRLALFSNISPIHADFIVERFPGMGLFTEAVFSFRTGDIKPNEPMYREAVERLGMAPEETFYIDDRPENIETGERLGFVTHLYDWRKHDELLEALGRAGVR